MARGLGRWRRRLRPTPVDGLDDQEENERHDDEVEYSSHEVPELEHDVILSYVPSANYNGPDQFSYQACDPAGLCASTTVFADRTIIAMSGCKLGAPVPAGATLRVTVMLQVYGQAAKNADRADKWYLARATKTL